MKMGDRIRDRRKAAGWSQTKLAEESGISQQMLSKLERGVASGTTEIVRLARALNVSPKWLESGEEPMTPMNDLPPDERQLLEGYRTSSPAEKAALLTLAVRGQTLAPTGKLQIQGQGPVSPMQPQG